MKEPRYIVVESSGYPISPGRAGQASSAGPRTEVMVLDRGYCHRVVWSSWTTPMRQKKRYRSLWRGRMKTSDKSWTTTGFRWSREKARAYADELAARLNAEDAADMGEDTQATSE